jgi:hypothetical protein
MPAVYQNRPCGHNNNVCPDKRGEERFKNPETGSDKRAYKQNRQGYAGNIPGSRYILIRHRFFSFNLSPYDYDFK